MNPLARLALEDGTIFSGPAFGACDKPFTSLGEVVFNTAMCGYQEALTDPSYAGQILAMTAPMIGNYGVNPDDVESSRPQVAGFVVRELARTYSNNRADGGVSSWLKRSGVLGIEGIDTRALVRRLRLGGAMRGALSCDGSLSGDDLVDAARGSPVMTGRNLAAEVSPREPAAWDPAGGAGADCMRVVAIDCGAKRNIYRSLVRRGCHVESLPMTLGPDAIRERRPDGLFVSNGPGDPEPIHDAIATLRELSGEVPTFGICLGLQLLALALGARTYKLKFGHRGANQPVRNVLTGAVEITSQNHGFCVDAASLEGLDCEVTHVHLNDGTVAGFRHRSLPIFAVQYHPEASPGPHDSAYLFDCFLDMMRTRLPIDAETMTRCQEGKRNPVPFSA